MKTNTEQAKKRKNTPKKQLLQSTVDINKIYTFTKSKTSYSLKSCLKKPYSKTKKANINGRLNRFLDNYCPSKTNTELISHTKKLNESEGKQIFAVKPSHFKNNYGSYRIRNNIAHKIGRKWITAHFGTKKN